MRSSWSSRFAGVRRSVFARHANPWSAWSRWATVPLVLVPVWTRRRTHAMPVVVWWLAASVTGVVAVVAAYRRPPVPMVVATAVQMALLLVYWELMVRYLERSRAPGTIVAASAR